MAQMQNCKIYTTCLSSRPVASGSFQQKTGALKVILGNARCCLLELYLELFLPLVHTDHRLTALQESRYTLPTRHASVQLDAPMILVRRSTRICSSAGCRSWSRRSGRGRSFWSCRGTSRTSTSTPTSRAGTTPSRPSASPSPWPPPACSSS